MIESSAPSGDEPAAAALREELAREGTVLRSATPIMRHLLAGGHTAIFAEEIVARVRGAIGDVARQLLAAGHVGEPTRIDPLAMEDLAAALIEVPGLVSHVHALAIEWQLTHSLKARAALDPILSPLLEALLASDDSEVSALAMNLLAAQARFAQTQRRMELPITELPADLLHGSLVAWRALTGGEPEGAAAEVAIRADYDEGRTRLALTTRLVRGMGRGAVAALDVAHAGATIFATALAMASGQDREVVVFSTADSQALRLALALRAAGLEQAAIERQLLALGGAAVLPAAWQRIGADAAFALLAAEG